MTPCVMTLLSLAAAASRRPPWALEAASVIEVAARAATSPVLRTAHMHDSLGQPASNRHRTHVRPVSPACGAHKHEL